MNPSIGELNKVLKQEVARLGLKPVNAPGLNVSTFCFERHWDEHMVWISDNLTVYKGGKFYETTMSPEKFMAMGDKAKRDFLTFLDSEITNPTQQKETK